jgi:hypothetical protein
MAGLAIGPLMFMPVIVAAALVAKERKEAVLF